MVINQLDEPAMLQIQDDDDESLRLGRRADDSFRGESNPQFRSYTKTSQRVKRSQRKRKKFAGSVVDHD